MEGIGITLESVKRALNITWTDAAQDERLNEIIEEADAHLRRFAGRNIDYNKHPQFRILLYDCIRYIRAAALPEFDRNYERELNTLHDWGQIYCEESGNEA